MSDWDFELPKEVALWYLDHMECRSVRDPDGDFGGSIAWKVEVNFRGQWVALSRTDWKDDVCTNQFLYLDEANNPAALVAKYRLACSQDHWGCNQIGARVRLGEFPCFAVIDRASDG